MERFLKPECKINSEQCNVCKYSLACKNTLFIELTFNYLIPDMKTISSYIEELFNDNIGNFECGASEDEVESIIEKMKNKKIHYKKYIENNYDAVCEEVKYYISRAKENTKLENYVNLFETYLLEEIIEKVEERLEEMNVNYKIFFLDYNGVFAIPFKGDVKNIYKEKPMFLGKKELPKKYKDLESKDKYYNYVGGANNCDGLIIAIEGYKEYMDSEDPYWDNDIGIADSNIDNALKNLENINVDRLSELAEYRADADEWEEEFWHQEEVTYQIDKSWKQYMENKKRQITGFLAQGMKNINLNKTLVWC